MLGIREGNPIWLTPRIPLKNWVMLRPAAEDETLPRNTEIQTSMQTKRSLASGYVNCHPRWGTRHTLTLHMKCTLIYEQCGKCGVFKN